MHQSGLFHSIKTPQMGSNIMDVEEMPYRRRMKWRRTKSDEKKEANQTSAVREIM